MGVEKNVYLPVQTTIRKGESKIMKKNIFLIIISTLALLTSCFSKKHVKNENSTNESIPQKLYLETNPNQSYDIVNATVKKIGFAGGCYIIYLQASKYRLIVPVVKRSCNTINYKKKIEIGKKYTFKLNKLIFNAGGVSDTPAFIESQTIGDKMVWTADMKNTFFYESCENMCGLNIKPIPW